VLGGRWREGCKADGLRRNGPVRALHRRLRRAITGRSVARLEAAILCLICWLAVAALAAGWDEDGGETCPTENATNLGWLAALRKH
jgi:hypothetical protein